MGRSEFSFKRFTVRQGGAAMKVGTDGVLLGGWCPVDENVRSALDVGTGTGLVALMIAQRGEAWGCSVDAVEIDESSCRQADENFGASPWSHRLKAYHERIQDFVRRNEKRYDLVVSNPPYFVGSLLPPDASRSAARHTTELTYGELVACAGASMADDGAFTMIMPFEQATQDFILRAELAEPNLYLHDRIDVHPNLSLPPKRSILTFRKRPPRGEPHPHTLYIEQHGRHDYSPEYKERLKEFFLNF